MDKTLTRKQRIFVEAYLRTWNGSEAARQANYKFPSRAASRILKMSQIQAAIQVRLDEAAMQTNEVLARLAEQARFNVAEFFLFEEVEETDKNGQVHKSTNFVGMNWENFQRYGHLVKRLSWTKLGKPILELHDAQNALLNIGRHLGLFKDVNIDIDISKLTDVQLNRLAAGEDIYKILAEGDNAPTESAS